MPRHETDLEGRQGEEKKWGAVLVLKRVNRDVTLGGKQSSAGLKE